ncbi:MAG: PIN domain-containing protein [Litoreibacter sp.]
MRLLLDACVLYPTVMREVLLGVAARGLFEPLWSDRILEEWARAARKIGPMGETQARGEIALLRAGWPEASVRPGEGLQARLYLPDENDIHVLAAAISGSAEAIVTLNAKDFPRATLADEGVRRIAPDELLMDFFDAQPTIVTSVVEKVHGQAEAMMDTEISARALMKKARLPRLGKAVAGI